MLAARRLAPMLGLIALAGCGGAGAKHPSGPTIAGYRTSLNAFCTASEAYTRSLPALGRRDHLSAAALDARAAAYQHSQAAQISAVPAPASISGLVARLHVLLATTVRPTLTDAIRHTEAMRATYAEIGAATCLRTADAGLAEFRRVAAAKR